MTVEDRVVAEIKEVLQRNNCVLVFGREDWTYSWPDGAPSVKVVQEKDGQAMSEGAILHSD